MRSNTPRRIQIFIANNSRRKSGLKSRSSDCSIMTSLDPEASAAENHLKKNIWQYIKDYFDESSLHGFRYFSESNRSVFERYLWLFVILLVISGLFFTIISQTHTYYRYSTVMSMNGTETPVGEIPFPAITFCSDNYVPESLLNISELLMISQQRNLSKHERTKLETAALLCNGANNEPFLSNKRTYYDVKLSAAIQIFALQLYVKKCYSFTKSIVWRTKVLEPACHFMQYSIMDYRQCLTFNMLPETSLFSERYIYEYVKSLPPTLVNLIPYKYVYAKTSWSPETGFKNKSENIILSVPGSSYCNSINFLLDFHGEDIQHTCKPRSHGFMVIVHNPAEYPTANHPATYVEVDSRTILQITPSLIQTDDNLRNWKPEERGCYYSYERHLQFFSVYTTNNCDLECEANVTYQQCGCTTPHHPRFSHMPLCTKEGLSCASEILHKLGTTGHRQRSFCNCLPACFEVSYNFEATFQPRNWTYNTEAYNIPLYDTKRNSYVNILALYRSRKFHGILRVGTMLLTDFIADIGALMGLFFGFTFLCIFELFYYCSIRWITNQLKSPKYPEDQLQPVIPAENLTHHRKKPEENFDSNAVDRVTEVPGYIPFNF